MNRQHESVPHDGVKLSRSGGTPTTAESSGALVRAAIRAHSRTRGRSRPVRVIVHLVRVGIVAKHRAGRYD
jgi:hypothetical protein